MTGGLRQITVFLFGVSFAVSISALLILGSVLLLDWAYRVWIKKEKSKWVSSPLDAPLLIYYAWGIFTAFVAGSTSLSKSFTTQSAFLIFFLLVHGFVKDDLKIFLRGFIGASVFAGGWAFVQVLTGVNYLPNQDNFFIPEFFKGWPEWALDLVAVRNERAVGFRSHPLTYAEGLLPAFFFFMTLILQEKPTLKSLLHKNRLCVMGLGLVSVGVLLAQGRAVWLGLLVGGAILLFTLPKESRARWGLLALIALVGVGVSSPKVRSRLMSVFSAQSGSWGDQASKSTRFQLWEQSLNGIEEKPLMGHGLRGVRLQVKDPINNQDRTWSEAHNIFLQSALERGVVGCGFLIWILILCLLIILKTPLPWRFGLLATFGAFLVSGLTESWMKDKEVAMIFWALIGTAEFLRRKRQ